MKPFFDDSANRVQCLNSSPLLLLHTGCPFLSLPFAAQNNTIPEKESTSCITAPNEVIFTFIHDFLLKLMLLRWLDDRFPKASEWYI